MRKAFLICIALTTIVGVSVAQRASDTAMAPGGKMQAKHMPKMAVKSSHYECAKCHAQWSEADAKKNKFNCPCCKDKMTKKEGAMDASYMCKKCNMKWSAKGAKAMNMKCMGCGGKLTKIKM